MDAADKIKLMLLRWLWAAAAAGGMNVAGEIKLMLLRGLWAAAAAAGGMNVSDELKLTLLEWLWAATRRVSSRTSSSSWAPSPAAMALREKGRRALELA